MIVGLQEEGTENLSLKDEKGQLLHVVPQFFLLMIMSLHRVLKRRLRKWRSYNNHLQQILNQSKRGQRHQLPAIRSTRSSREEAKEEDHGATTTTSKLVQERPVTSVFSDKVLTESVAQYAKLQELLHCTNEENNLLKQCLEEKDQKLSVLKGVMDQDKALLEEVSCENNILKQCLKRRSRS